MKNTNSSIPTPPSKLISLVETAGTTTDSAEFSACLSEFESLPSTRADLLAFTEACLSGMCRTGACTSYLDRFATSN